MSPLTCKRCGGGAALRNEKIVRHRARGIDCTRSEDCDAPLHSAAQRVVEAAVRMYGPPVQPEPTETIRAAVAALLAAREEDESADA